MADQAPAARKAPAAPDLPPPPGLVAAGAQWETLADGYVYTDSPAGDPSGDVYYAEPIFKHLYKVDAAGNVTLVSKDTEMTMGLVMGPDGLLYGCRNLAAQIVRFSASGELDVLYQGELTPLPNKPTAPGEFCNDMAINADGGVWFTDRINRRVLYLDPQRSLRQVAEGFRPNGIVLSADRQMLVVTDSIEAVLHAFRVGANGALTELPDYFDPVMTVTELGQEQVVTGRPGTNGMTVDSAGRFYLASFYGIQVFAPDGGYIGVIGSPAGFLSNLGFGGSGYQWLYASGRKGFYRLEMNVHGIGWPAE
jgi:gluconolactonase